MNPETGDSPKGAIAIVGMSGRFPGARSIEQFWQNLRDGIESRVEYSDEELAEAGVAVKVRHPRHVKAGFPLEDFEMFDSAFFGINPREAEILDPQHRLFLECAWHALENAGYDSDQFPGTIGIFGGSTWSSYLVANLFRAARLVKNVGYRQLIHGSVPDYMVTRAAYRLNLKGPAYSVQCACSTSLVAVHLACQNLAGFDAVAGLDPEFDNLTSDLRRHRTAGRGRRHRSVRRRPRRPPGRAHGPLRRRARHVRREPGQADRDGGPVVRRSRKV